MKSPDLDRDTSPDWDMPTTMWSRDDAPVRPTPEADPRAITLPDIPASDLPVLAAPTSVEIPIFEDTSAIASPLSTSHAVVAPASAAASARAPEAPRREGTRDRFVLVAFVSMVVLVIAVLMAVTPGVRTAGHGKIVAEVPAASAGADATMDARHAERRAGASVAVTPLVQVVTETKPAATVKPKTLRAASPTKSTPRERTFAEDVHDAQDALAQAQMERALR